MKILFSIVLNATILFVIAYFLSGNSDKNIVDGVILGTNSGIFSMDAIKTYLVGGIILGIMNVTIKPIIKILALPFYLIFLSLVGIIVNGLILWLFDRIVNDILLIPGISYSIVGTVNFIIAVAIFTFLNMIYSLIFSKK